MLAASCAAERRYKHDYEDRPELSFVHEFQRGYPGDVLSMRGRVPRRVQRGEEI
jgi:hypothetical protein